MPDGGATHTPCSVAVGVSVSSSSPVSGRDKVGVLVGGDDVRVAVGVRLGGRVGVSVGRGVAVTNGYGVMVGVDVGADGANTPSQPANMTQIRETRAIR